MDAHGISGLAKAALSAASVGRAASSDRQAVGTEAAKRQQAAQEFASLFFLEVLKTMRATLPQQGLFENESLSRDIYTAMLDAEIAKVMGKRDTTGFVETVKDALAKAARPVQQTVLNAPVEGVISSNFGARIDPLDGAGKTHQGIDIAAPAGSTIRAAAAGTVVFSGRAAGYGNIVDLEHAGGVVTRYAHNSGNLVAAGDRIRAGQPIGLVGSSGRSTGPHLHFEVLNAGNPVNPLKFLEGISKGGKLTSKA